MAQVLQAMTYDMKGNDQKAAVNSQKRSTVKFLALQKVGAFGVSIPASDRYEEGSAFQHEVVQKYKQKLPLAGRSKLSKVELTLSKKIKNRTMIASGGKVNNVIALNDRKLIEELRQGLRTQPPLHPDATSVLEAIADPNIRESRLFYEPLHKLSSPTSKKYGRKSHQMATHNKLFGGQDEIQFMNVAFPPSQHHFNTPMTTNSNKVETDKSRSTGSVVSRTMLPKVPKNHKRYQYSLSPDLGQNSKKTHDKNNLVNLPAISLKIKEEMAKLRLAKSKEVRKRRTAKEKRFNEDLPNNRPVVKTENGEFKTQKTNTRNEKKTFEKVKTTATGKSHLISPMNKMDMIVEYSKMLQNGSLNYKDYIKNLSVLSLHKVGIANEGGLRQYHLVRDKTYGMKPKLTRVDIHPMSSRKHDEGR